MATRLACPLCHSTDALATVEHLDALARIDAVDGDGSVEFSGSTDVLWDTSATVGIHCSECDWESAYDEDEDGPLADFLVTVLAVESDDDNEEA